ncbi:MAG: UMP kinase, partial [Candidatus Woesearchaeota archaeon]
SSGFHPGNTTDYVAVLLAKKFNVKTIVNLTNIDYVYDKDPKKYKSAKPVKDLNWNEFFEIMGKKFSPGMNSPFDPVAAKEAQENGLKVLIANGHKIANLDKLLYGEIFKGTIIQ